MNTRQSIVIVGGGLAAPKRAEALREQGFDGTITLVAAESHLLPYELLNDVPCDDALVR